MKNFGILACLVFATGLIARADNVPTLTVDCGADCMAISLTSEGNNVWGIASPTTYTLANGASFTLNNVTLDMDPSVHYAIGVTNADGATGFTPYTFTFTTPTTLAAGLYSVSSSLAGSLTDGESNGVTLQPVSGAVQQAFIGTADAGVDLLNTAISQGPTPTTQIFGPFTANSTANVASPVSQISVTTSFQLSDDDSASLSGRFDVNAVPEPSSLPMAFVAAGAFGVLLVRAHRSRLESAA